MLSGYPDSSCLELRNELASLYDVSPDNIYVGNGSDGVLADVFRVLREDFESLSVLDVGFRVYLLLARRFDFRVEQVPGNTFSTGRVEPRREPTVYAVDTPNSVTGVQIPPQDISRLAEQTDSFLVLDNVHGDFANDRVPPVQENVAFIRSFSKYFGLAGVRVGYCIAHETIVRRMMEVKDIYNVSSIAQRLALEALHRRDLFRDAAERIVAARDRLVDLLERLDFDVHPPAANFVFATPRYADAASIQQELEQRGILVRRFSEPPIDNSIRITVPPEDAVDKLQQSLISILQRLSS